jgi:hypothetical protein
MDSLLNDILSRMNISNGSNGSSNTGNNGSNGACGSGKNNSTGQTCGLSLSPSQALVIVGILGGVLQVDSVLVDRDQEVQIILSGSLKQTTKTKSPLDKLMDQLGALPFDDVVKAIVGRLV